MLLKYRMKKCNMDFKARDCKIQENDSGDEVISPEL